MATALVSPTSVTIQSGEKEKMYSKNGGDSGTKSRWDTYYSLMPPTRLSRL